MSAEMKLAIIPVFESASCTHYPPHEGVKSGLLSLDGEGDDAHAVLVAHSRALQTLKIDCQILRSYTIMIKAKDII